MTQAPEIPTTTQLAELYPMQPDKLQRVHSVRQRLGALISGGTPGLLAIIGPCAMTDDTETIHSEAAELDRLNASETGLVVLHRLPPWKPRSNPVDWHGRETTDPVGAFKLLVERASISANLEIEIGRPLHIERYAGLIAMARIGGRNVGEDQLIEALARQHPSLPIGIKNGLDGEVHLALRQVKRVENCRGNSGAPAIVVYRGGENARTPAAWETSYKRLHEHSGGRFIVDMAHGSEMAHHQDFKKSADGQLVAMEHVIELAESGFAPLGVMVEASDASSPTDPHLPFQLALEGIRQLNAIRPVVTFDKPSDRVYSQ